MKVGDFITNEDLGSVERVQALRDALNSRGYVLEPQFGRSSSYEEGGCFGLIHTKPTVLAWYGEGGFSIKRTVKYDDVMSELLGDDYKPNNKVEEPIRVADLPIDFVSYLREDGPVNIRITPEGSFDEPVTQSKPKCKPAHEHKVEVLMDVSYLLGVLVEKDNDYKGRVDQLLDKLSKVL